MIRKVNEKDLRNIYNIYRSLSLQRDRLSDFVYQMEIQKKGFLLGVQSEEVFTRMTTNSYLTLVFEENSEIKGYISADNREKYKDDEYKTWFNTTLKDIYYNSKDSMTISGLGVLEKYTHTGIAIKLYTEMENQLKKNGINNLFSIVTVSPVTNCPSLIFHTKHRFKRIAAGSPRHLFNIDNYSSVLFYKKLNDFIP